MASATQHVVSAGGDDGNEVAAAVRPARATATGVRVPADLVPALAVPVQEGAAQV